MTSDTITVGDIVAMAYSAYAQSVKLANHANRLDKIADRAKSGAISPAQAIREIKYSKILAGLEINKQSVGVN